MDTKGTQTEATRPAHDGPHSDKLRPHVSWVRPTMADLSDAKGIPSTFLSREFGVKVVKRGMDGCPPLDAWMMPYWDENKQPLAPRYRMPVGANLRFWMQAGQRVHPYALWRLPEAREKRLLFLVEGESDTWTLWYNALPALGLPGTGGPGSLHKEHLEGIDNLYLVKEGDEGGETFTRKVIDRLEKLDFCGKAHLLSVPEPHKDVNDLYRAGVEVFLDRMQECVRESLPIFLNILPLLNTTGDPPPHVDPPTAPPTSNGEQPNGKQKSKPSAAARLVHLALERGCDLFHDSSRRCYARVPVNGHWEVWEILSQGFIDWLVHEAWRASAGDSTAASCEEALATLRSLAICCGPERATAIRVAQSGETFYLDLCDQAWQVVEITTAGWKLLLESPIPFVRSPGLLALPVPCGGGKPDLLRDFINVPNHDQWALLLTWLVQAYWPKGPYPVLCIGGQQGCGKSFLAEALKALVDPAEGDLRSDPAGPEDLAIAAGANHLLCYDNLSRLSDWMSDAVCRLSTGGAFATRTLYTNREETLFKFCRPVILGSIVDVAKKPDVLERAILLDLPTIPRSARQSVEDLRQRFLAARPQILGSLLDLLVATRRQLPSVQLTELPRMADFCRRATAAGRALGWHDDDFGMAYRENQADATDVAVEADVLGELVFRLLANNDGHWKGAPSDLLAALAGLANADVLHGRGWPRTSRLLSDRLKRLAPALRSRRVTITHGKTARHEGRMRFIELTQEGEAGKEKSDAIPAIPW